MVQETFTALHWAGGAGGVVFKLSPGGTETLLYAFAGGSDGSGPVGGLISDTSGNFYGTTYAGGGTGCADSRGCGTVFKLAPDGTETVLYAFKGGNDGATPFAGLVADKAGNVYGTTSAGGGSDCYGAGCGSVFRLAPNGTETVLHSFGNGRDGAAPEATLLLRQGTLYGTTSAGGSGEGRGCHREVDQGCGTIFSVRK